MSNNNYLYSQANTSGFAELLSKELEHSITEWNEANFWDNFRRASQQNNVSFLFIGSKFVRDRHYGGETPPMYKELMLPRANWIRHLLCSLLEKVSGIETYRCEHGNCSNLFCVKCEKECTITTEYDSNILKFQQLCELSILLKQGPKSSATLCL